MSHRTTPKPQPKYFRAELPPCFDGSPGTQDDFVQWVRRLEVAIEAFPESAKWDMAKILPSRLAGPAFNFCDSLDDATKDDYTAAKQKLKEVFSQKQKLETLKTFLNARPR